MVDNGKMVGNEFSHECEINSLKKEEDLLKKRKRTSKEVRRECVPSGNKKNIKNFIDDEAEEVDEYEKSFIDDGELENDELAEHLELNAQLPPKNPKRDRGTGGKHIFAKGWFCTWPKCTMTKEAAKEDLEKSLKNKNLEIKEYVISEEKHKDGEPHLHAFIKLNKRVDFKKDLFDLGNGEWHGNYQVAKSWRAVEEYVEKDGNFISNINIKAAKAKKSKLTPKDLGRDPLEVLEEGLITPMQLANFYKNHLLYLNLLQQSQPVPLNLKEIPKRRHYWVYGETNSGKTSWVDDLKRGDEVNWFQIPKNNDWVGYNGQKNLYIDEFAGELSIQALNELCDGNAKVNVKGGSTCTSWICKVYVLSNYTPLQLYHSDSFIIETLFSRFHFYELKDFELQDIDDYMNDKLAERKQKEEEKRLKGVNK